MKKKTKNSVHILVVAIVAVVVSIAFVVSLPTIASEAQEIKAANELAERRTMTNTNQFQPNTVT